MILKLQKRLFMLTLFSLVLVSAFAQKEKEEDLDRVYWSADRILTVDDFGIKTKNMESGATSALFSMDYNVSRFNFLMRNFNKRVRNFMVKSGSQIDTTGNVEQYLLYQQTLFNLSEVYAREFRKALRENAKKMLSNSKIADELNEKIVAEYSTRRAQYTQETNSASIPAKQKEWEDEIKKELDILADFVYGK